MTLVFSILIIQALLGAFDNLWHHELEARLPSRPGARRELALHAARECLYGLVFLGLAWFAWHGALAWLLAAMLATEVVITLVDFLEEDLTRRLPPLERVLHTILALCYGAFLAALSPVLWDWAAAPTALVPVSYGLVSWFFTLGGLIVLAWSLRNIVAALRLSAQHEAILRQTPPESGGDAVLIAGGTGFIGSALVARLVAEGRRVIVLTRDARQARASLGPRVLAIESLDHLPAETRIGAMVNLAGAPVLGPPWTSRRRRQLIDSRTQATRALIALAARLEQRPRVLVAASAIGFYGAQDPDADALDETAPPRPGSFQSDLCQAVESAAADARAMGLRVVLARFGLVLGRGGGSLPPQALAARLGLAAILGTGRQVMSWVHLQDAVGVIRQSLDDPRIDGPINVVAPETARQREFAMTLAAAQGRAVHLRVPEWLLRRVLGEMAELLVDGQCIRPTRALAAGYAFRHPGLGNALADLAAKDTTRGAVVAAKPA